MAEYIDDEEEFVPIRHEGHIWYDAERACRMLRIKSASAALSLLSKDQWCKINGKAYVSVDGFAELSLIMENAHG